MKARVPILVALATVLVLGSSQTTTLASPTAQGAREITVLVGSGRDEDVINAFFPREVRIRAGDTITWRQNSDAAHDVAFPGPFSGPAQSNVFSLPEEVSIPSNNIPVPGRPGVNMANPLRTWPHPGPEVNGSIYRPGELVTSGRLRSVPQTPGVDELETFSLTFDTPGTYRYICFTHAETMPGVVEVVAGSVRDVPSQAEIDAQAQVQLAALWGRLERAKAAQLASPARSEPGSNGSTVWYVSAGLNYFRVNEDRIGLDEFLPRDLTVTSGDSVIWASTGFHAVTFNPSPIIPPLNLFETLPDGSRARINNPEVWDPVKPTAVFDPTLYYVSGNLSRGQPFGTAWTLAFETPGSFEYYCAVHRDRGMVGSITVVAQEG